MSEHIVSDFNFKIRLLQAVNHLALVVGFIAVALGVIGTDYLWIGLVSYLWFCMIGTTIGLHRYFSHRSFKTSRVWEYIMAWSGTICTVGTIIGWAGLHRYHHAHTDTLEDPHNPHEIGKFNAWVYNWKPSKFTKKFIRLELSDPMIVFMHRHYFKIIFSYILVLALINPWLVIWCYALPACGAYLAISAVTVIGHIHGYVNYEVNDSSKNSWITSLLSVGEGWHNNHHATPYNHRQGHKRWELDPAAWIIEKILMKNI